MSNIPNTEEMMMRAFGYLTGARVSHMVHIGQLMGLYGHMVNQGPLSAQALAEHSGLHPRWVLEWLRGQAAAQLITYHDPDQFELSAAAAEVLIREGGLFYLGSEFMYPTSEAVLNRIPDAFKTGVGLTYDDQGSGCACGLKSFTLAAHKLLPNIFTKVSGLVEKLEVGAQVLDVGCGAGVALIILGKAFPNSTFVGVDPSRIAIDLAKKEIQAAGLSNVSVSMGYGENITEQAHYDLAMTLDVLHDMPYPDRALRAIRKATKPDGVLLIKDIRCSDSQAENIASPIGAFGYAVSVALCMSSAMSVPDGAGLGTMGMNPKLAEKMCNEVGFSQFQILDIPEDAFNYFYVAQV